jgi:hypothetical protein
MLERIAALHDVVHGFCVLASWSFAMGYRARGTACVAQAAEIIEYLQQCPSLPKPP